MPVAQHAAGGRRIVKQCLYGVALRQPRADRVVVDARPGWQVDARTGRRAASGWTTPTPRMASPLRANRVRENAAKSRPTLPERSYTASGTTTATRHRRPRRRRTREGATW